MQALNSTGLPGATTIVGDTSEMWADVGALWPAVPWAAGLGWCHYTSDLLPLFFLFFFFFFGGSDGGGDGEEEEKGRRESVCRHVVISQVKVIAPCVLI